MTPPSEKAAKVIASRFDATVPVGNARQHNAQVATEDA